MDQEFNLPKKATARYTCRRTFCFSEDVNKVFVNLEKENVDIPTLIRILVEEGLEKRNLLQGMEILSGEKQEAN